MSEMIPSLILADRLLLSKNIYFLRKRKKMSRVAFARYIHMSTTQLFCIERKILDAIFLEPLMNISKIYGIPADEILTEDLEKKYAGKRFHYNKLSTESNTPVEKNR